MFRNRIRQYDAALSRPAQPAPAFAPIFACIPVGREMLQMWASVYEAAKQQAMRELAHQEVDGFLRNFAAN
jgi:hypothetical protein